MNSLYDKFIISNPNCNIQIEAIASIYCLSFFFESELVGTLDIK